MGKRWHEDARLLKKKTTFTDFISCTEFLVKEKYVARDKVVARGGSAGGLLMGVIANLRPDLFRIIVADVPSVDKLNNMLDESLFGTVNWYTEYGNPQEKRYYDYIKSYCPYQNVEYKNYPHFFVTAGYHDGRVRYWQAAKWVAKLRDMKKDDNLILLKTKMSGHFGATGRYDRYHEIAQRYAFIFWILGIE
jgi:oligopeptidase B